MRQGGIARFNHDVDSLVNDVEVEIRNDDRDLDQLIDGNVEPGHLAVDPHQVVAEIAHGLHRIRHGRRVPPVTACA